MLTPLINKFIYRPDITSAPPNFTPTNLGLRYEAVTLRAQDGVEVAGWYVLAPQPRGVVLYLHGNAGHCGDWVAVAPQFVGAGYHLFILDYRGYGQSAGQPAEKGLYFDGQAAWAWLTARAASLPVFVLGKSLGSGVATYLATHYTPAGLILDSAYTSMREVVAHNAPWLPAFFIPRLFESWARAAKITCPTLLLHGDQDTLIPLPHALRLYRKLQAPKVLSVVRGAGHNDVDGFASYYQQVLAFMQDPVAFCSAHQAASDAACKTYTSPEKR